MDPKTKQEKSLNMDELEEVTGGADKSDTNDGMPQKLLYCSDPRCMTERIFYLGSGGRATCSFCHTQILY